VATLLAFVVPAVAATGCGGDDAPSASGPGLVWTANPERTFAPLLEAAADDPWRPMSARWFIERSSFWFAEDDGCADRKIAVGHTLPEQQNEEIDWIFPRGLGGEPAYYRNPYDPRCELDFDLRFDADQLTRPHDPGPRVDGVRPGEGFYLDLVDEARPGPQPAVDADGKPRSISAPVYSERIDEGDGGVRLAYWMLFGVDGMPGDPGTHEGDWERVDVLLRDAGDGRYEPLTVQLPADGTGFVDSAWEATRRAGRTHPVVQLARGTHDATVVERGAGCAGCLPWEAWRTLADAREQSWYGFGGAWGEVGAGDATTGPLGPHRHWPSASERERERGGG
jgi:hypothetical protein